MNLKLELQSMNIHDLKIICKQLGIVCYSSKSQCIKNILNPIRNKYKKNFLYNPTNPKKSFDVYIDKDPSDTISIKYKTVSDVKNTIKKLERLYKSKKRTHKRIWQVAMIMKVRLEAIKKKTHKANDRYKIAEKYFYFLKKRTKMNQKLRYKSTFKF